MRLDQVIDCVGKLDTIETFNPVVGLLQLGRRVDQVLRSRRFFVHLLPRFEYEFNI